MNDREVARDLSKRLEKAQEEIAGLNAEIERLKEFNMWLRFGPAGEPKHDD
jgi:hypothetical protein